MPARVAEVKSRSPRWVKDAANVGTRAYALATVRTRPAPDMLIVGTKRGGTTSLFNYLLRHPGFLGLFPQVRGKKSTDYFFRDFDRGERWYRSHYHTAGYRRRLERRTGQPSVTGEASPYYLWDPRIAARVHALAPSLKAIALVRDPVERAWSHYQERRQNDVEPLSFADALAAEPDRTEAELPRMLADPAYFADAYDWYPYRQRGVYLPQLQNWVSVFPREQLLVLRSEDMYADPQAVFDQVTDFLGLARQQLPTTKTFNASARAPMEESARRELEEFYAPHNAALAQWLGRDLGWSS